MERIPFFAFCLLPAVLAGCAGTGSGAARADQVSGRPVRGAQAVDEVQALVVEGERSAVYTPIDRQIIREAHAALEVEDPHEAAERIVAMVAPPGFVESTERGEEWARLVLRVPATGLDSFVESLSDVGDVESLALSGRDVTDQMIDWEARLENLIELRDRLRLHMDRATTVQDLVLVERELARVQSEIDSLSGRLEATRASVALSRIAIDLREKTQLGPLGYLIYGLGQVVGWLFVID